jgi:hypothetical protein
MYPPLQGVDLCTQVPRLEVPVSVLGGAHELTARSGPAREWFDRLQAPTTQWTTLVGSWHVPQSEEFGRSGEVLRGIVAQRRPPADAPVPPPTGSP